MPRTGFISQDNLIKNSSEMEKKTVAGYVLTLSPKKSSKKNNRQYFNVDLETDADIKGLVCFSLEWFKDWEKKSFYV